jgi:molybdopterin synthase catalytic subunit
LLIRPVVDPTPCSIRHRVCPITVVNPRSSTCAPRPILREDGAVTMIDPHLDGICAPEPADEAEAEANAGAKANAGAETGTESGTKTKTVPENPSATPVDAVRLVDIRPTPLSVDEVLQAVSDPHAGGIALFIGAVRDHTPDRPGVAVTELEYSAHPAAREQLAKIARAVADEHPGALVAAVHRVGELAVGDLAVVVAAACAHRAEAFAACRALIDTLKQEVPIWKRETFRDGSHTWVGI